MATTRLARAVSQDPVSNNDNTTKQNKQKPKELLTKNYKLTLQCLIITHFIQSQKLGSYISESRWGHANVCGFNYYKNIEATQMPSNK